MDEKLRWRPYITISARLTVLAGPFAAISKRLAAFAGFQQLNFGEAFGDIPNLPG